MFGVRRFGLEFKFVFMEGGNRIRITEKSRRVLKSISLHSSTASWVASMVKDCFKHPWNAGLFRKL